MHRAFHSTMTYTAIPCVCVSQYHGDALTSAAHCIACMHIESIPGRGSVLCCCRTGFTCGRCR